MEFILGIKEKGINTEYYLIDNKKVKFSWGI
jgi:hypothetical protein